MTEEDIEEAVQQCPELTELDKADGNSIPWPYIYLGFMLFKVAVDEIGLFH